MTTKEIAEAAGVTTETVRNVGKDLFPTKFENGKRTVFTQSEAIKVMSNIRKKGFIQPTNILELPPQNLEVTHDDSLKTAFQMMAMAFDRLSKITESQEQRLQKIETRIEERQALLPAPQIKPRDHINKLVREYAERNGENHSSVWSELYREYGYRTNSAPRIVAQNKGYKKTIDYIDDEGQIETLQTIAIDFLK